MDHYNWKKHYAFQLRDIGIAGAFSRYSIKKGSGEGQVISCPVFPGVQAVYNDLSLFQCGRSVPRVKE